MSSVIALICLFGMVTVPSILNVIAYPVSHKWSMKISSYIVNVLAPRLFSILNCYKKFHFWGYYDSLKDLPENYMIISNHQSILDIALFMNFYHGREIRFVAKDALGRHVPLISEVLRTQEHCLIPRHAKPMEAMDYLAKFGKRTAERNQIPILFPEGTRTKDGNVGKFYSAGFRRLSESSGLPVVVCALDGGWRLRDLGRILRNLTNGCYRVKALKVFPNPKTKEEAQAILDES